MAPPTTANRCSPEQLPRGAICTGDAWCAGSPHVAARCSLTVRNGVFQDEAWIICAASPTLAAANDGLVPQHLDHGRAELA
jgi:hypothetical protein